MLARWPCSQGSPASRRRSARAARSPGVTLEVAAGEAVLLVGRNGAGKTTLLRIATGLSRSGCRHGRDRRASRWRASAREAQRQLGYLPEHAPAPPELTVREHLRAARAPEGRRRLGQRAMHAAAVASEADRRIGTLSKGFRQRVGLADALLGEPPLLVLDEPTSGMDPIQTRELREHLDRGGEAARRAGVEPRGHRPRGARDPRRGPEGRRARRGRHAGRAARADQRSLARRCGRPAARRGGARGASRVGVLGVAPRARGHAARADRLRDRWPVPRRPGHRVRRASSARSRIRAGPRRSARCSKASSRARC